MSLYTSSEFLLFSIRKTSKLKVESDCLFLLLIHVLWCTFIVDQFTGCARILLQLSPSFRIYSVRLTDGELFTVRQSQMGLVHVCRRFGLQVSWIFLLVHFRNYVRHVRELRLRYALRSARRCDNVIHTRMFRTLIQQLFSGFLGFSTSMTGWFVRMQHVRTSTINLSFPLPIENIIQHFQNAY